MDLCKTISFLALCIILVLSILILNKVDKKECYKAGSCMEKCMFGHSPDEFSKKAECVQQCL